MVEMSYRHSLFFLDEGRADEAESWIRCNFVYAGYEVEELDTQFDGDSNNWEVRFYTSDKLARVDVTWLIGTTEPNVYAVNCEVY